MKNVVKILHYFLLSLDIKVIRIYSTQHVLIGLISNCCSGETSNSSVGFPDLKGHTSTPAPSTLQRLMEDIV